jgi:hypothetical protein
MHNIPIPWLICNIKSRLWILLLKKQGIEKTPSIRSSGMETQIPAQTLIGKMTVVIP